MRGPSEYQKTAIKALEASRAGLPRSRVEQGQMHVRGEQPRAAKVLYAPAVLSFGENHDEMLGMIRDYQLLAHSPNFSRVTKTYVVDLSEVKSVSLDAALVLVAEYHRSLVNKPGYRPYIDDMNWPSWVRRLFEMLGFYKLVKPLSRTSNGDDDVPFNMTFVPFVSASDVQGVLVDELIEQLKEAAGTSPKRIATYGALLEAIKNVRNHAYPADAEPQLAPRVERWWGAGAYFPEDRTLGFAMYDQGVGIPATLPRRSIWEAVRERCPAEFNDADVIAGAIELGRTSTGLLERGNGLWTICNLVRELPGSHVRIISGRGELSYASDDTVRKKLHANPFCGTLIEWSLVLPSESQAGAGS